MSRPGFPHVNVPELNARWLQRIEAAGKPLACSCSVCGRALRDEASIKRGIGPVCLRRLSEKDTRTMDLFA